jgi:hypothetical protein
MSRAHCPNSAPIQPSSSLIWASSCCRVRLAAIAAFAFSFVPSPATTSRDTRPSRAQARTDSGSSAATASMFWRTNSATVE